MQKLVMECIGAFFLVLVIALTGDPLAIGAVLMVMVYMGGHISGAHYNPAVTFGVWLRKKITTKAALWYVAAQIIGALVAVGVAAYMTGLQFIPAPGIEVSMGVAFVAEVLFSFALVSVVLYTTTAAATAGNSYFGLAIGFTVLVGALAVGSLSGAVFNPAVGLGPWIYAVLAGGGFSYVWFLYVLAPLLAGGAAGLLFDWMHTDA